MAVGVMFAHARTSAPRHSPVCHLRKTPPSGWRPRPRRGIVVAQASVADQPSFPTSGAESDRPRSLCPRSCYLVREPAPYPEPFGDPQPCHVIQVPQGVGGSEIPTSLFLLRPSPQARPQRPLSLTHRGDRGDETPQCKIRLCAHLPTDLLCLRRAYR